MQGRNKNLLSRMNRQTQWIHGTVFWKKNLFNIQRLDLKIDINLTINDKYLILKKEFIQSIKR